MGAPSALTMQASRPIAQKTTWFIPIGIASVFLVLLAGWFMATARSSVRIQDQKPGRTIRVAELSLARPGWLVVNRVNLTGGDDEIAATPRLTPEQYREFDISLKDGMPDLATGDFLFAVLYEDRDGNKLLDTLVDRPMNNRWGRPIRILLRVK